MATGPPCDPVGCGRSWSRRAGSTGRTCYSSASPRSPFASRGPPSSCSSRHARRARSSGHRWGSKRRGPRCASVTAPRSRGWPPRVKASSAAWSPAPPSPSTDRSLPERPGDLARVVRRVDLGSERLPRGELDGAVHFAQARGRYAQRHDVTEAHRDIPGFDGDAVRRELLPEPGLFLDLVELVEVLRLVVFQEDG